MSDLLLIFADHDLLIDQVSQIQLILGSMGGNVADSKLFIIAVIILRV